MAEYGNNYDYGQSPYYKDDDYPPDGDDKIPVRSEGSTMFSGIIIMT